MDGGNVHFSRVLGVSQVIDFSSLVVPHLAVSGKLTVFRTVEKDTSAATPDGALAYSLTH